MPTSPTTTRRPPGVDNVPYAVSATPTADAESPSPLPSGVERRKQPRRAYPFVQMIAPIVGGNLPAEKDFRPMHCRNISTGGLAFLSPTLPTTDSYVVALGSPPRVSYLVCRVIHVLRLPQAQNGPYAIGCTFVGRTTY